MMSLLLASVLCGQTAVAIPVHITPTTRSPAMLAADLDEDGVVEQVLVGFSLTREIEVSVYEPDGRVARLSLGRVVDFSGVRDELYITLPDPDQTGAPLLLVTVPAAEQCGSWDRDTYITYQDDSLRPALVLFNGSDAPAYTEERVVFHPATRTATLTVISGDDTGETTTITRRALVDGVYAVTETIERVQVF
jgi:hypothetical protein